MVRPWQSWLATALRSDAASSRRSSPMTGRASLGVSRQTLRRGPQNEEVTLNAGAHIGAQIGPVSCVSCVSWIYTVNGLRHMRRFATIPVCGTNSPQYVVLMSVDHRYML